MRAPCSIVTVRWVGLALLLATSGCSNVAKPGPQSVAGMSPDGTVSMSEVMAVGAEGGKGTLTFQGHPYPFQLVGGVTGGGGAADTQVRGEVYSLQRFRLQRAIYSKQRRPWVVDVGCQRSLAAQRGRGGASSEGNAGGHDTKLGP